MVRVSAALVTYNHKILLFLRDNKPTINDPNKWSLIGGHVEEGEDYDIGLLRELEEEICVKPKNYYLLMTLSGYFNEEIQLYHVPLRDEEALRVKLGNEGQKIEFFTLEQMDKITLTTNLSIIFKQFRGIFEEKVNG